MIGEHSARDVDAGSSDPTLSAVVIVFGGGERLERCLDALAHQTGSGDIDVIVPHDSTLANAAKLRERFPRVRFIAFEGRRPPAELRARGVERANGRVVALLEDHCIPEPEWRLRVLAAHERSVAGVGGSVEKGMPPNSRTDSALNWALYIADYGRYMSPLPEGPTHTVSDCNASYKRSELQAVRDAWTVQFHENVVNDALRARGGSLMLDSSIVVREQRSLTWGAALRDRYAFGRLFGATRVTGAALGRRLGLAAAAIALPPLLVVRAAKNLLVRHRHVEQLARALPALLVLSSAWAFGEMLGYLTVVPEASLRAADAGVKTDVARGGAT
jgi:glycosyltransferase involved in cell wall biosynthesis